MLPLWAHNVVAQGRNSTQELASISQPRHRHRRHSLLAFSKPPFATIVYHRKNSFLKQTMHHMIHSGQWDCRTSTNFAFDPTQFLFWIKTLPISLLNKKYCRFLFWIKTLPTPFSWQPMASFAVRKSLSCPPSANLGYFAPSHISHTGGTPAIYHRNHDDDQSGIFPRTFIW